MGRPATTVIYRLPIGVTTLAIGLLVGRSLTIGAAQGRGAIGTSSLSGIVLSADDIPKPIGRAVISLRDPTQFIDRHTVSNDEGRFDFQLLPPGRYFLEARRPAYVSIPYGSLRPGRPGTPIIVETNRPVRDVQVRLARGAVITGTVRDANGVPISGIDVSTRRIDSRPTPNQPYSPTRTDDRGVFRIFGLAAGRYIVYVVPAGTVPIQMPTDEYVDQMLGELTRARAGQSVGSAPPVGRETTGSDPVAQGRTFRPVPVYYPGVFTAEDAETLVLQAGEERSGVDIIARPVSASDIAGTIASSDLARIRGAVVALTKATQAGGAVPIRTEIQPDGTFHFSGVAPGRYLIVVTVPSLAAPSRRDGCEFASQELFVVGNDLIGLSLQLRPCLTIAGRLRFEGRSLPQPSSLQGVHVSLEPDISSQAISPLRLPAGDPPVGADGTFVLGGRGEILPGAYHFRVDLPGAELGRGWWLQSAVVDGQDVLDAPLQLTASSPATTSAVLTFTDQHTSLSGLLMSDGSASPVNYTMLAFTTRQEWWRTPYRRVAAQRVATNGEFRFQDLPPGEYYLAALTDLAPDDWRDPQFLAEIVPAAMRVTINPGEQKTQDVKISRFQSSFDRDVLKFEIRDSLHSPVKIDPRR